MLKRSKQEKTVDILESDQEDESDRRIGRRESRRSSSNITSRELLKRSRERSRSRSRSPMFVKDQDKSFDFSLDATKTITERNSFKKKRSEQ